MDVQERWYLSGRVVDGPPSPGAAQPGESLVHWTAVTCSLETDRDELADLLRHAGVLAPALHRIRAGAVQGGRRPSLRRHGEVVELSLRALTYVDARDAVETQEEWLLVRGAEIVSVTLGNQVPSAARSVWDRGAVHSPADALGLVLESVGIGFEDVVVGLEEDVVEVEQSVFSDSRTAEERRIYALKREVAETRRAVAPLVAVLDRNHDTADPVLGGWRQLPGASDMVERLHRLTEIVETLDDLLSSALDAHVARISVQQNEDMRRISAGAALIVVPTFMAGVWGMNFQNMPELRWTYGYPMALVLMALSVVVLWVAFRRSGWF